MSIQSEVDRIGIAKNAIRNAIEAKGVSVPSDASIDDYAEKISEIRSVPVGNSVTIDASNTSSSAVYCVTYNVNTESFDGIPLYAANRYDFNASIGSFFIVAYDSYSTTYTGPYGLVLVDRPHNDILIFKVTGTSPMISFVKKSNEPVITAIPR